MVPSYPSPVVWTLPEQKSRLRYGLFQPTLKCQESLHQGISGPQYWGVGRAGEWGPIGSGKDFRNRKICLGKKATSGNLIFWDICKETRVRLFLLDSYTLSKKSWTCRKCSFNEVLWRLKEVEGAVFSVWEGLQDSLLSYSRVQSLYVCARVYTHINTGICFRACPS